MVIHAVAVHTSGFCLLVSVRLSSFVHIPMSNSCMPSDDIEDYCHSLSLSLSLSLSPSLSLSLSLSLVPHSGQIRSPSPSISSPPPPSLSPYRSLSLSLSLLIEKTKTRKSTTFTVAHLPRSLSRWHMQTVQTIHPTSRCVEAYPRT